MAYSGYGYMKLYSMSFRVLGICWNPGSHSWVLKPPTKRLFIIRCCSHEKAPAETWQSRRKPRAWQYLESSCVLRRSFPDTSQSETWQSQRSRRRSAFVSASGKDAKFSASFGGKSLTAHRRCRKNRSKKSHRAESTSCHRRS